MKKHYSRQDAKHAKEKPFPPFIFAFLASWRESFSISLPEALPHAQVTPDKSPVALVNYPGTYASARKLNITDKSDRLKAVI